jgi:hypothetical protein
MNPRFPAAAAAAAAIVLAAACSAATTEPPAAVAGTSDGPTAGAVAISAAPETPASKTVAQPSGGTRKCLGAVEFIVNAASKGSSVCIAVGGIVRVEQLGPGPGLRVDRRDKVSCFYAGGVHVCRLIFTGTVKFRIEYPMAAITVTVTIAQASSPPQPSPACSDDEELVVSAHDAMPFSGRCVRVGSHIRLEDVEPQGFTVNPANAVSCLREPAVSRCRFTKTATVGFTFANRPATDILYVVAIS